MGQSRRGYGLDESTSSIQPRGLHHGINGTIDYQSGAIDIRNAPPNANFVVSGLFATAIGTGGGTSSNGILGYIYARSVSQKVYSKIQLIAFGR